jgi:hypothetical protein
MTLAAIAVAACAGGNHAVQSTANVRSEANVRAQANKICHQYTSGVYTLPRPLTRTQTHANARTTLHLLAGAYQQLTKLKPPARQANAYQLLIADSERAIATATQIQNATANNRRASRAATNALTRQLSAELAQLKRDARPVNLTACT